MRSTASPGSTGARPALALVIAGGDVLAGDRFGRLGLSLEGARERDLLVASELEGVPSVWLPGGGYSPRAWRALAGTGMALATGSLEPIPAGFDPLTEAFHDIARSLSLERLEERLGAVTKQLEQMETPHSPVTLDPERAVLTLLRAVG